MVRIYWKLIVLGIGLLAGLLLVARWFLPTMGVSVPENVSPALTTLIILAAIPVTISAFLPYKWGNILREISYLCLFLAILILELYTFKSIFTTYTPPQIVLEKCSTLFGTKEAPTEMWDALGVWGCVTSGYFPASYSDLGWTIFAIFYLILPFAFVWTFLYGLMGGLNISDFFGGFGGTVQTILSFIIAMYASRQLFGFFILDFYAYGAWGLIAVFGATCFVLGLKRIMENWFRIDEMAAITRAAIETEIQTEKSAISNLNKYLDYVRSVRDDKVKIDMLNKIIDPNTSYYQGMTGWLESTRKNAFMTAIRANLTTPSTAIREAKKFLT